MATQFENIIQNAGFHDRANGASVGGKSAVSKVPNKAVRKPLGEISNSNSLKPSSQNNHLTQKQHNPVENPFDFTFFGDEKDVQKSKIPLNGNKNLSKAEKNATLAARKPLGDISNSRKPALLHNSHKTKVKNTNGFELGDPCIIHQGFLHNHSECIKTQRQQTVDIDYFLETIGYCVFSDSSLKMAHSLHSVSEEEVNLNIEMPELLHEECSPLSSKAELKTKHKWSPLPPCKSPQSPSLYMQWSTGAALDCCLAETPTKCSLDN